VPGPPSNWPICIASLPKSSRRRKAREWVLRALYAGDMIEDGTQDQLAALLAHDPPAEIDLDFARRLYDGVRQAGAHHDGEIEAQLENWDLERLALIDLLLLRMALVEFERFPDVPESVTLNESIELAKQYSGAQAGAFINGVLDAVLRHRQDPTRPTGRRDSHP
jgi:N utilization substance protein B